MDNNKIIIIAILAIVICVLIGAIFGTLTKAVDYERIEITPNGTSIEIPTEKAKYDGEINGTGAKMWTFKQGSLFTFNSEEAIDGRGLYGLGGAVGFKAINDEINNHFEKREEIGGYTVYTIDGQKLGIENRHELYCIILGNDSTHDNIIITADNKDIALHMANSIRYKVANITTSDATSNDDITYDASSTVNKTTNNADNNKYSENDLRKASQEGYNSGYSDGYSDSLDYYDVEMSDSVSSSSDFSSSDSSSVDSVVTTTDDVTY